MDNSFLERTIALVGEEAVNKLNNSKVVVFGLGGVGSACVEVLVRSGIGHIQIIDYDRVNISNLNRQIISNINNLGEYKTDVTLKRINSINPNCEVIINTERLTKDNLEIFNLDKYDYVVDAIDDVPAKLELILYCNRKNINIISSMGTGKKMDPTLFRVTDIYKTKVCPLARKMRKHLKDNNVDHLKVVYSEEKPVDRKVDYIPSIAFVPPVAGMILGGAVIKDLISYNK